MGLIDKIASAVVTDLIEDAAIGALGATVKAIESVEKGADAVSGAVQSRRQNAGRQGYPSLSERAAIPFQKRRQHTSDHSENKRQKGSFQYLRYR